MIRVTLLGHIRTSLGTGELSIEDEELDVQELVDRLRTLSKENEPGFNRFNTLAMVDDGEAFVPATVTRRLRDGERVVLIPFSHGG